MAASLGALAKETGILQDRLTAGATAKAKGLKGVVVKGLLVKEVLGALVVGGILALLTGIVLGLARLIGPELAAVAVGSGVLAVLGLIAWRIGRSDA